MEVNVLRIADATVELKLSGRVTFDQGASALLNTICHLLDHDEKTLVVDLGATVAIDCCGAQMLILSYANAVSRGAQLWLMNLDLNQVQDLSSAIKLLTVFGPTSSEPPVFSLVPSVAACQ